MFSRWVFVSGVLKEPVVFFFPQGNVQMIVSTAWSFAALADGILVTWGDPRCGGDSRMVQEQLGGKVMLGGC